MGIHSEGEYLQLRFYQPETEKVCVVTCGDDHSVHDDSCSIGLNINVLVLQQSNQDRKYCLLANLPLPELTDTETSRQQSEK